MRKRHNWWGLYLVGALGLGLLAVDALAPLSQEAHDALTVGTILLVCGLALLWTENHADLIERSGADAWASKERRYRAHFISDGIDVLLRPPADELAQCTKGDWSGNVGQRTKHAEQTGTRV